MKQFQDVEPSIRLLRDIFGHKGPAVINAEIIQDARRKTLDAISTLTTREAFAVHHRYGFDDGEALTLREVGKLLLTLHGTVALQEGVSPERARQILCKALRKLRHPMRSRTLRPIAEVLWPAAN